MKEIRSCNVCPVNFLILGFADNIQENQSTPLIMFQPLRGGNAELMNSALGLKRINRA